MGQLLSLVILVSGAVMTWRTRFIQRRLLRSFASIFKKEEGGGEISAFGALCTTLAATLGIGNIVGVAGAVAIGGPGALFWMVLSALFGMALKYAECFLAVGNGGPFGYIKRALGSGWAKVFAFCGAAAGSISIGTSLQMDSVIGVLAPNRNGFSMRSLAICILTATATGLVLLGGAKGIAAFCQKVIPVVSIGYFLCCGIILWNCRAELPVALLSIIKGAFCPAAVLGGASGGIIKTMSVGISRGVFSNEAGLGSAPIASAAAGGSAERQGLLAMSSVFLDTVVMCFLSGLCIVVTGAWQRAGYAGGVALAFRVGIGEWSVGLLSLFLCIFAFTTIVGWYFFAGACFRYLTGDRYEKAFRLFYILMLLVAPFVQSDRLWLVADALNVGMALPNIFALLAHKKFFQKNIDLEKQLCYYKNSFFTIKKG